MDSDLQRRIEAKKKSIEDRKTKIKDLQIQIQDILFEYDGLESNVPINHGYWDMVNMYKQVHKELEAEFLREREARNAH